MKIAIIGGGWVGCHIAMKLMDNHQIVLFDRNEKLFSETSYKNQNRLHYGFHYARNHKTRNMCKDTFNLFMSDYGFLTKEVKHNLYCVPSKESIIDYNTYVEIFKNFEKNKIDVELKNIDGCINTNERYINFELAKEYFNEKLKKIFVREEISEKKMKKLSQEYDLIINATNNSIKDYNSSDCFYELTISFVYSKTSEVPFDALTLVDGKFFSLYPYTDNKFTLTDVEYTPIKRFSSIENLNTFVSKIDNKFIKNRIKKIEKKVYKFLPNFNSYFKYNSYFLSTKIKVTDNSDIRYPIITKNGNIINCSTGKIQGIYIIENYIKNEINNW
jgi:hypothetical protein